MSATTHDRNNFDALRLLGASLVLVSHQFPLSARGEPHLVGNITVGVLGLMLFFSISGYLIAGSWIADPSLQRFTLRRVLRIWPALAAFVIVSSLLLGLIKGDYATAWRMLANLVPWRILDARAFAGNPLPFTNGSLWSIPLEIACYAGFAALAVPSGNALRLLLAFMAALTVLYGLKFGVAVESGRIRAGVAYLPFLACFFFNGAALAFFRPSNAALAVVVAASLAIAVLLHNAVLALILTVPVISVHVGSQSWRFVRDAGKRGDVSYGFYLWAWPAQQVVILFLGPQAPVWLLLAVSAPAALVLAIASWHLIERPFLRLKPRKPASRGPQLDAAIALPAE